MNFVYLFLRTELTPIVIKAFCDYKKIKNNIANATSIFQVNRTNDCVRMIESFAHLGLESIRFGNYNAGMAIALALDSKPIARLEKVWKKLQNSPPVFQLKVNYYN